MTHIQTDLNLTPDQASAALSASLGRKITCTGMERLHGGMINTVLRLDFDEPPHSAVIKFCYPGGSPFAPEARSLRFLHEHTRFPVPQVYGVDDSAQVVPYAYLLLETLPGECLAGLRLPPAEYDHLDRQLAEILLDLHSHTRRTFGALDEPGYPQVVDVFLPKLLEVRAQPEVNQRLAPVALANVDRAVQLAPQALSDQGQPTLVHGDLWAGNLMVKKSPQGWRLTGIVDPTYLHYGDVEEELAYLEVFNERRDAFFQAYTAGNPLRPGYEQRRRFYWLNTALVHVWLFGDAYYSDYTAQVAEAICRDWGFA